MEAEQESDSEEESEMEVEAAAAVAGVSAAAAAEEEALECVICLDDLSAHPEARLQPRNGSGVHFAPIRSRFCPKDLLHILVYYGLFVLIFDSLQYYTYICYMYFYSCLSSYSHRVLAYSSVFWLGLSIFSHEYSEHIMPAHSIVR